MVLPIVLGSWFQPKKAQEVAPTVDPCRDAGVCGLDREQRRTTARKLLKAVVASMTITAVLGASGSSSTAAPPANDGFSAATEIALNALPFSATVDITEATQEYGESFYCNYSYQTVWYKLTPTSGIWLGATTQQSSLFGTTLNVYRADSSGSGIFGLSFVGCSSFGGSVTFHAQAGTTYYLQAMAPCCYYAGSVRVDVQQVPEPLPVARFYWYPGDPSSFETVLFQDQSYDPGQQGIQSQAWNFGDGATATGCCPTHRYAADGAYVVQLTVTTSDGRTADTSQVVTVKTHDVAITKFRTPESASAGQTRPITVGIRNRRFPETVRVELLKSVPGGYYGYQSVGTLVQFVPVRSANRTTDFGFSYTFTSDDARIGKVTFKAVASLDAARDALPADNEAVSSPVKVSGSAVAPAAGGAVVEEVTGETRGTPAAARLALLDVTPNPAGARVDLLVRLSLPVDGAATLEVLDVAGRVMAKRDLSSLGPGIHEARAAWERRPPPGIYWVRLTHGGQSVSKRVSILP